MRVGTICTGVFVFPTYWELYACVVGWAWRTKSIWSGTCLVWVTSKEFVMGGTHAKHEQFSSSEVLLLGWVSEGVYLMLKKLENAMTEGVHSRKGGYACLGPSEEFGWRAKESVKQDYERDRLVGWTMSEEGRGSTRSPM